MVKKISLDDEEQLLLIDALACLNDAIHWAGASDTDRAEKAMALYQKLGGEVLFDDETEASTD